MQYSSKFLIEFLDSIIRMNKECKVLEDVARSAIQDEQLKIENAHYDIEQKLKFVEAQFTKDNQESLVKYREEISKITSDYFIKERPQYARLYNCKEVIAELENVEKNIIHRDKTLVKDDGHIVEFDIEELLKEPGKFREAYVDIMMKELNPAEKGIIELYRGLLQEICLAKVVLYKEVEVLQGKLVNSRQSVFDEYVNISKKHDKDIDTKLWIATEQFEDFRTTFYEEKLNEYKRIDSIFLTSETTKKSKWKKLFDDFSEKYPKEEMLKAYEQIYEREPSYCNYACVETMPVNVRISTLEYNLSGYDICDCVKDFLLENYYFIYKENTIRIPYCAYFDEEFNYSFEYKEWMREHVVKDARDICMRLFMLLPPGKLNFTFIDPVKLGESFAMFTRLVDVDDRTSEIINGKIWSSPADIEDKLKIMTAHISNVTQRCLQGKYNNIFEYNQVAEQNAEAYQVLVLMDFPAGLSDQSLKLLEQIVTSGPKCGVFTIIYKNESQYQKFDERGTLLISNIEFGLQKFSYSEDAKSINYMSRGFNNQQFVWSGITMPNSEELENVISVLKKGIKSAEKVVIGIDKVENAEHVTTTKDGIRIPIGIHGANEIQYLTLGVGGSHHALIAGVAGSGKSSLLHTIILRTLKQYSPDELSVYLVDFKRGVEFKIYADFVLPTFKVVAIESEREFGYNILLALEREQKIRADLFKKSHVDKIEEYRDLGKKMPRILVIMDEFHELFSSANDEFAKKSAVIMERIVRQGRAFGVHLILASQSYSNISGIDRAVFDQMAVRIVLKCSKTDANLLLDGGSSEVDQISIDDPGRAVYNSEAGNKEYNSHFRVAYIEPSKHREMLQEISDNTKAFADSQTPTRILLSNIEDNNYSIFNQFATYNSEQYTSEGRVYIGEPLSVNNNMAVDFARAEYSNLLMVGNDTDKARSMFTFAILSLCINYWIVNRSAPIEPFITLYNCKPLEDSYFKDMPKVLAELLPQYVNYIDCGNDEGAKQVVTKTYSSISRGDNLNVEHYLFVFGYQRADVLKQEKELTQSENIGSLFNMISGNASVDNMSYKDMFQYIVRNGSQNGIHTIIWQDSFNALQQDDKDIMSYFSMKVAFDMTPEEYSRYVGVNDLSLMNENNAIYYSRTKDSQKFRPYQSPDEDWVKEIAEKLI